MIPGLPLRIFTEPQQGASYDTLLAVAQETEALGFDAFILGSEAWVDAGLPVATTKPSAASAFSAWNAPASGNVSSVRSPKISRSRNWVPPCGRELNRRRSAAGLRP